MHAPMSDALCNQDILSTVFGLFDQEDERVSLYHLALACKAFKGPALSQLWRSMDSLLPLLMALPELERVDSEFVRYPLFAVAPGENGALTNKHSISMGSSNNLASPNTPLMSGG